MQSMVAASRSSQTWNSAYTGVGVIGVAVMVNLVAIARHLREEN